MLPSSVSKGVSVPFQSAALLLFSLSLASRQLVGLTIVLVTAGIHYSRTQFDTILHHV